MKLEVEYKKADGLIPYIGNSRTHSSEQIKQIAASIKEFGFTNPILLDGENGIIAGHGRLAAANLLKLNEVPTIELAGLTATQKKAYIIADNKLALNAGWDSALLGLEVEALKDLNFDIGLLGFSDIELDELELAGVTLKIDSDIELTSAPAELINEAWQLWAGEIYEQLSVLTQTSHVFQGITKGYAIEKFLRAKYDGKEYPRHCSLAFHPHQILCMGAQGSLIDGLSRVSAGDINPERLRFVLADTMDCKKMAAGSLAFAGARMPLDFPASLAASLYNEFAADGKVLDPCHGWGGRAVGFLLSEASQYVGVDASPDTHAGVQSLIDTLEKYAPDKQATVYCSAFEKWVATDSEFDFALTSPPYFDVEQYIGGEQSHTEYGNYEAWRAGFYTDLIQIVYKLLRKGGVFALQIGSQSYPLLVDGKKIAQSIGFSIKEVRATDMTNTQAKTEAENAEVILILQK